MRTLLHTLRPSIGSSKYASISDWVFNGRGVMDGGPKTASRKSSSCPSLLIIDAESWFCVLPEILEPKSSYFGAYCIS